LEPPKENVLPACLRKPELLWTGGTGGIELSTEGNGFLLVEWELRHSSCGVLKSADEGVIDTLLWREELSDAVLVVLELPLPLEKRSAKEHSINKTSHD
jgi:hypothetical protein